MAKKTVQRSVNSVFYPGVSGKTKYEVIKMINERFEDNTFVNRLSEKQQFENGERIGFPNIEKLTDEVMQKYVDKCAKVFYDGLEHGVEHAAMQEEDELVKLAKKIQTK